MERGEAEQPADDEGGGGAEDARDEGTPGDIVVGEEGAEEAEDPGDASGVEAHEYGPTGIGVYRGGWGGGGVGHEGTKAHNGNAGQAVSLCQRNILVGGAPFAAAQCVWRAATELRAGAARLIRLEQARIRRLFCGGRRGRRGLVEGGVGQGDPVAEGALEAQRPLGGVAFVKVRH